MTADRKNESADEKGEQAAITPSSKSQNTPAESQSKPDPKPNRILKAAHAVGSGLRIGAAWVIRGLNNLNGLITALATVALAFIAVLQWGTFEKTDNTRSLRA